eukprot:Rhum_TRINITY_DN15811_c0_g1::Rhum_TRINITY_DN15811_c0_g1_i1::g.162168::m.162168
MRPRSLSFGSASTGARDTHKKGRPLPWDAVSGTSQGGERNPPWVPPPAATSPTRQRRHKTPARSSRSAASSTYGARCETSPRRYGRFKETVEPPPAAPRGIYGHYSRGASEGQCHHVSLAGARDVSPTPPFQRRQDLCTDPLTGDVDVLQRLQAVLLSHDRRDANPAGDPAFESCRTVSPARSANRSGSAAALPTPDAAAEENTILAELSHLDTALHHSVKKQNSALLKMLQTLPPRHRPSDDDVPAPLSVGSARHPTSIGARANPRKGVHAPQRRRASSAQPKVRQVSQALHFSNLPSEGDSVSGHTSHATAEGRPSGVTLDALRKRLRQADVVLSEDVDTEADVEAQRVTAPWSALIADMMLHLDRAQLLQPLLEVCVAANPETRLAKAADTFSQEPSSEVGLSMLRVLGYTGDQHMAAPERCKGRRTTVTDIALTMLSS